MYPDIFEATTFSFWIQKFPRPHVQKYPDSLPNSLDACGQKPYPERKTCRFKNIQIRVDGASDFSDNIRPQREINEINEMEIDNHNKVCERFFIIC